jgi:hypothetical protein
MEFRSGFFANMHFGINLKVMTLFGTNYKPIPLKIIDEGSQTRGFSPTRILPRYGIGILVASSSRFLSSSLLSASLCPCAASLLSAASRRRSATSLCQSRRHECLELVRAGARPIPGLASPHGASKCRGEEGATPRCETVRWS